MEARMKLRGQKILVVTGSLLSAPELRQECARHGAVVYVSANVISVFELLRQHNFAGAVLDQSLHNEVFDLCTELQANNVPYVWSRDPQRSAPVGSRQDKARATVKRLLEEMDGAPSAHLYSSPDLELASSSLSELR
jgi:hypothetical protein